MSASHEHTPRLSVASPIRPSGPSYRVRVGQWLEHLDLDADFVGRAPRTSRHGRWKAQPSDIIYEGTVRLESTLSRERILIQKEASRLGIGRVEKRLIARSSFAIYDLDDAVYLTTGSRGAIGSRESRVIATLANVDRVIAGNSLLADFAREYCDDVRVIPSCIEPSEFFAPEPQQSNLVIGWIGSASTEKYLAPLYPVIAALQQQFSVEFHLVGAAGPATEIRDGCVTKLVPWSFENEKKYLSKFSIGVAPLADGPWERGKCGYKLLQYAAARVPTVGNPVGVAKSILKGAGGIAVHRLEEWMEALAYLLENELARRAIAVQGFRFVEEHYSFGAWRDRWIDAVLN